MESEEIKKIELNEPDWIYLYIKVKVMHSYIFGNKQLLS